MLKTAFISLYVAGVLSFGALAIGRADPYTGVLLQLFLNGLGLGLLLHAVHAHRSGVLHIPPYRHSRETGGLIYNVILVLMVLLGLGLEGLGLLFRAFG